jgi:hypothetical protein
MHDHKQATPEAKTAAAARKMAGESADTATQAVRALRAGVAPPAFAITALQRAAGNAALSAALTEDLDGSMVRPVISNGGQPLDPPVQRAMETQFGVDLSDVRVHTDGKATESARAMNADAYTAGSHIVFQRQAYQPGTNSGLHMLAHELSHVVQQREGPVSGSDIGGGISVSDPGDRFEVAADSVADSVVHSINTEGGIAAFTNDDIE